MPGVDEERVLAFQEEARAGEDLCSFAGDFQFLTVAEAFVADTGLDSILSLISGLSPALDETPDIPGYFVTLFALVWFALDLKLSNLARLMMDSS